jgi:hypothetical protein
MPDQRQEQPQYPIRLDITRGQPVTAAPRQPSFGDYMSGALQQQAAAATPLWAQVPLALYSSMRGSGGELPSNEQGAPAAPRAPRQGGLTSGLRNLNNMTQTPGFNGALQLSQFVRALTGQDPTKLSRRELRDVVGMMPAPGRPQSAKDALGYQAMDIVESIYQNDLARAATIPDKEKATEEARSASAAKLQMIKQLMGADPLQEAIAAQVAAAAAAANGE